MGTDEQLGVVLVHGIGEQTQGETLTKFTVGVGRQMASEVDRVSRDRAVLRLGHREVRVYETWWADILGKEAVDGSFDPFELHALAWFPWLNQRFGFYRPNRWAGALVWTILLTPVLFLLHIPLLFLPRKGFLPRLLDRVFADVTNYVSSAGHAMREDSTLAGAAVDIQRRFAGAIDAAAADGCTRIIVIAHSLGTVIAYHGLTGCVRAEDGAPITPSARSLVTDLVTIGSPLEKVRWLWPSTMTTDVVLAETLRWHNIRDRLDVVSGKMRHFGPVVDLPLVGRANLIDAHVVYERNPAFVRLFFDLVGLGAVPVDKTPTGQRLGLLGMSMAVSTLFFALALGVAVAALLGVTLIIAVFLLVSAFFGMAELVGGMHTDVLFQISFWSMAVLVVGMGVGYGRVMAGRMHYAFRHRRWP
ncbi:hypothetical protein [Actinocrispum sp. NPDC049592]|uniref:hypothetical protein n=1 Tax=Actinocrispum sp. NPDC049592 TaxID=3154835 RepID=UPI00343B192B